MEKEVTRLTKGDGQSPGETLAYAGKAMANGTMVTKN
jgi:hypothetical protein